MQCHSHAGETPASCGVVDSSLSCASPRIRRSCPAGAAPFQPRLLLDTGAVTQTFDYKAEFQGAFHGRRTTTRLIVVHHAAAHYKQNTGLDDTRAIRDWHVRGRGWGGIGYHVVIAELTNGGPLARYLVSDEETQRAHIWGRNHEAIGICCATDFGSSIPQQRWIDALALALADLKQRYPKAEIAGHRDVTMQGYETSCPGTKWAAWRPGLLAQVERQLKARPPARKRLYLARCPMPVLEARSLSAPIALGGAAELGRGAVITVDDVTEGWAHLENGVGFVPAMWLSEA